METRLPIPKHWQDFEILCHKLWRDIWNDANAQRHGRQGQAQHGVDIWGVAVPFNRPTGVQCKDKDGKLGSVLTTNELKAECRKAKKFLPAVEEFTMATTAARDAKLQKLARDLTAKRTYPFSVHVWSWDEIEEELRYRPALISAYYPEFKPSLEGANRLVLSRLSPKDQLSAFFKRPDVESGMAAAVREQLLPVSFELAENAFIHGKATRFSIRCEEDRVVFEDDGQNFNPVIGLDPTRANLRSHIGSLVFDGFRQRFGGDVVFDHNRDGDTNRFTCKFARSLSSFGAPLRLDIPVDLSHVFSRDAARRLAASILLPAETKEVVLVVVGGVIHSGTGEFFSEIAKRLQGDMRLVINVPTRQMAAYKNFLFRDNDQVSFVAREPG